MEKSKETRILIMVAFALSIILTFFITRGIYTQPMGWLEYTGEYPLNGSKVLRLLDDGYDGEPSAIPSKENPLKGMAQIVDLNGGKEIFKGTFVSNGDGMLVIYEHRKRKAELCFTKEKAFYIEDGKKPIATKKTCETTWFQ